MVFAIEIPANADVCDHDGVGEPTVLPLAIQRSAAGFYLGTFCPTCGPYDRASGYFGEDRAAAAAALARC
jgi:hypothetical protein